MNAQSVHDPLFELDNARNQSESELPQTFVETPIFSRMLSAKNQILMGSRGSGKTAILKMLSHSYLSKHETPGAATAIIQKRLIGVYVPITTLWIGALNRKMGANDEARDREFLWLFSVAACQSLLRTAESCLATYFPDLDARISATGRLIDALQKRWLPDASFPYRSLAELGDALADLGSRRADHEAKQFVMHADPSARESYQEAPHFMAANLGPFLDGLGALAREISAPPETALLVCIDEVETLDEQHQRILNSFMRSHTGRIFFKVALLPYAHRTLQTNLADPLRVGHDFEYLWIEEDPVRDDPVNSGAVRRRSETSPNSYSFARTLYEKQRLYLQRQGVHIETIERMFGSSLILRPIDVLSSTVGTRRLVEIFNQLAASHFDEATKARMRRLEQLSPINEEEGGNTHIGSQYADQLVRKTLGFLIVRDQLMSKRGRKNARIYSGAELVVRLADGNPRTLVRLMNLMVREGGWEGRKSQPKIPDFKQHQLTVRFSKALHKRLLSEETPGPELHAFTLAVGDGLAKLFYRRGIGSDHVGQFRVDESEFENHREVLELGMALGVIKAELRPGPDFTLPNGAGEFRLAYSLCPAFSLMPRRGRARSLAAVLSPTGAGQIEFDFSDEQ